MAVFNSGDCANISPQAATGFVCETWSPNDPTVAQVLLGTGYQVACHPGKSDKCIAVKKTFGAIVQCNDPDFCLEGLDGRQNTGEAVGRDSKGSGRSNRAIDAAPWTPKTR